MYRFLLRPSWLALGVVSLSLAVLFVSLGMWQLRRLDEQRTANATITSRLDAAAIPLDDLWGAANGGDGLADLEFRRVSATGAFDPTREVLIRSQTHRGEAGFHVITPLQVAAGLVFLVNRGWVPLEMDTPPVAAAPPLGTVTLTAVLQPTQTRSGFGPADPDDGVLLRMNRVDVARIGRQIPADVLPLYGVSTDEGDGTLPVPVVIEPPGDGPHLSYALQWFAFALISIVGFAALARSTARRTGKTAVAAGSDSRSS